MTNLDLSDMILTGGMILAGGTAGFGAGWAGRVLLARLRRGVSLPRWWCESAVAVLWSVVALRAAVGALPVWWMGVPLLVGWLLAALTGCDVLAGRLPDAVTLTAYPAAVVVVAIAAYCGHTPALVGRALVGAGLFAASYALIRLLSPKSLGAGDVKLAGSLGVLAGAVSIWAVVVTMFVAALLTLVLATRNWRGSLPHGPAMLLPAWIVTTFPSAVLLRSGGG